MIEYRAPAWHAQHPNMSGRVPLCGTVGSDGRKTHRVALMSPVTCKRCLRLMGEAPAETATKEGGAS